MPVSKRTRFEVLKRDNHTCRYCGGSAPDVILTVDHVTPVSLGGGDKPDNLVAACRDCNAGKSSTSPSADAIEDVRQADIKWAGAIKRVSAARARQHKRRDAYIQAFESAWEDWTYDFNRRYFPLPVNYRHTLSRFHDLSVPADEITRCVRIACGNDRIAAAETFRYFAGCVWRVVTEMQDAAKLLLDAEGADRGTD